jgi:NAD(P)-dependent dehydrogenase (short-subunit alcohol dehydrogenase family)
MGPRDSEELTLVTGASSGIGAALARALAREGAALALVGRDQLRTEESVAACRAAGARAEAFLFDLEAQADSVSTLVDDVEARFGRPVTTLIHAGGRRVVGLVEDVPAAEVRGCFAVNLFAAFSLSAALAPRMRRRRSGHIVFVTSGTAHYGIPTEAAYSASKAGLERLAEGLRLELEPSGVAVTLVSPGLVETPMVRRPAVFGATRPIPVPDRAADPDAVAAAVLAGLLGRPERVELTWRSWLARRLACAAPSLLAWRLRAALRAASVDDADLPDDRGRPQG